MFSVKRFVTAPSYYYIIFAINSWLTYLFDTVLRLFHSSARLQRGGGGSIWGKDAGIIYHDLKAMLYPILLQTPKVLKATI